MNSNLSERKLLQRYIKEAKKFPQLEPDIEKAMITKVKEGSRPAINALVNANLLFVVKIAYKYRNQGLEIEDLISAGNIGLIIAAMRVDPSQKNKFITYAVWWIRQSIRYAIFNQSRLIRLAANKEEKLRAMYKANLPMRSYIGGTGLDWQQAIDLFGAGAKELYHFIKMVEPPVSLDMNLGSDEGLSLKDVLAVDAPNPHEELHANELKDKLQQAMNSLGKKEQQVLKDYYGLDEVRRMSLTQIGEASELSKERIRQIKDKALSKLRKVLVAQLVSLVM